MRERTGKQYLTPVSGLFFFSVASWVVWRHPPDNALLEIGMLVLIWLGVWLVTIPVAGKKTSALISIGVVAVALMNRLGILDPLTLLLLVVILIGIGSV